MIGDYHRGEPKTEAVEAQTGTTEPSASEMYAIMRFAGGVVLAIGAVLGTARAVEATVESDNTPAPLVVTECAAEGALGALVSFTGVRIAFSAAKQL